MEELEKELRKHFKLSPLEEIENIDLEEGIFDITISGCICEAKIPKWMIREIKINKLL